MRAFLMLCLALALVGLAKGADVGMPVIEEPTELREIAPSPYEGQFGARMSRTMALLATSNPTRRQPVRILLYGQSIVGSGWWHLLEKELRARFPHADLTVENRAIGGFTAPSLVRTAVHDLYPYYADLVIFHVFDGAPAGDYERIISNLRRYTTSDILVFTHHVGNQNPQEGKPWEEYASNINRDHSADNLRYLCQKYGCELVEVREEWKAYLRAHGLQPQDLLSDGIHLNKHGYALLTALLMRHFRFNPTAPGDWYRQVRYYEAKRLATEGAGDEITFTGAMWRRDGNAMVGSAPDSALTLTFTGNRVDVIGGFVQGDEQRGTAKILIDGKAPSAFPGCYAITRPSQLNNIWMPTVSRVGHASALVAEDWTFRITEMSEDARQFTYEVIGSVTGHDGVGSNAETFTSNSGRVVIEPRDLSRITWATGYTKKPTPVGFEATWKVVPLYLNTYTPPVIDDPSRVYLTTLAQGLDNGPHTLEIIPNGDGIIPIEGIQTYAPPLK